MYETCYPDTQWTDDLLKNAGAVSKRSKMLEVAFDRAWEASVQPWTSKRDEDNMAMTCEFSFFLLLGLKTTYELYVLLMEKEFWAWVIWVPTEWASQWANFLYIQL